MTLLDLQLKSLRDAAIKSITQVATRMKEEATDVKATIGDIEDWLDRMKQLAEEVNTRQPFFFSSQQNLINQLYCLSSASEQHAGCNYLDVKRREAGSLCQSSSQSDPAHQLQRAGSW